LVFIGLTLAISHFTYALIEAPWRQWSKHSGLRSA
jgi:peptidoglycan/LPS O-acetylase OafA/YrhL